jgi:hypothetical protein
MIIFIAHILPDNIPRTFFDVKRFSKFLYADAVFGFSAGGNSRMSQTRQGAFFKIYSVVAPN